MSALRAQAEAEAEAARFAAQRSQNGRRGVSPSASTFLANIQSSVQV